MFCSTDDVTDLCEYQIETTNKQINKHVQGKSIKLLNFGFLPYTVFHVIKYSTDELTDRNELENGRIAKLISRLIQAGK